MRFLISVIDSQSNSASTDEMDAIDKFNEKLRENGHWILACGIDSPKSATLIDNRNGANLVKAGSYNQADEYMSGFWLIAATDLEEAQRLAVEGSKACNRKVELRPLLG